MKKCGLIIFLVAIAVSLNIVSPTLSFAQTDIPIEIKHNPWGSPKSGIAVGEAENNRVFVPMRILFETFDATVDWQQSTKTITAQRCDGAVIKMTLDSNTASITQNNQTTNLTLDAVPKVKSGKTMVPLRFVAENLMCDVQWLEKEKKVIIAKEYLTNNLENSKYTFNLKTEELYAQLGEGDFQLVGSIKGVKNYYDSIGFSYYPSIQKAETTPSGNYIITTSVAIEDSRKSQRVFTYINTTQKSSNLITIEEWEWGGVIYNYYIDGTNIWLPEEKQVLKLDDTTGTTIATYDYKNVLEKALAINPFVNINEIDSIGFDFCDGTYMLLSYTKKDTLNTRYYILVNLATNEPIDLIAQLIPAEDMENFISRDYLSPSNHIEFLKAENNMLRFNYVSYDDLWQASSVPIFYQHKQP